MTIINLICPELSDIKAIRLECPHCGVTISCVPQKWEPSGLDCPNCEKTLIKGSQTYPSDELKALCQFSEGLKTLLQLLRFAENAEKKGEHPARFKLRLEFNQQASEQT